MANDTDTEYVIDSVRVMNKSIEDNSNDDDPFRIEGKELNTLQGVDASQKRRVTRQINKAYTGAGDARSVKMDERALTGYDAFGVTIPPIDLYAFAKLYEMSPGHYAACNAKTANIVGLGFTFVQSPSTLKLIERVSENEKKLTRVRAGLEDHLNELIDQIDSFNFEDTFVETLTKMWTDYEATGNGYLEIGRKKDGSIGYIGHIPSPTMRVRKDRDGFVQIVNGRAQFFRNYGDQNTPSPFNSVSNPNEVLHLKKYSPTNTFYGIPDIVAAQAAIAGNEYSSKYNLEYFANKAVPRYIITLKGAKLGPNAENDLLAFFETAVKGQNHRSIYIPLPADTDTNKVEFKMEPVEATVQEASFSNYRKANLDDILMAHRVPITKISANTNAGVAAAMDADKTFKEQVCLPQQKILEKKLNKIIRELTDAYQIKMNEMTLTDETARSKINDTYAKLGVLTRNEIRSELGKGGIEKGDEIIDINNKGNTDMTEQTTQRERDKQRQLNATDSQGLARNPKGEGRTTP